MASQSQEGKTWPPAEGLSTPTVPRSEAILTSEASTDISASAELVLSILLDTTTYASWCTFVPRVEITSQPEGTPANSTEFAIGTKFTFYAVMDSSKPTKDTATHLRITDISTPAQPSSYLPDDVLQSDPSYTADLSKVYRVCWAGDGGLFARGLKTERFHEVIVTGAQTCTVRTWESMSGILARTVKWLYKDALAFKYKEWCSDLKKVSEEKAGAQ